MVQMLLMRINSSTYFFLFEIFLIKPHLTQFVPPPFSKQAEVDAQNLGSMPSWIHRERCGGQSVLEQVDGKLTGSPAGAKPKG